MERRQPEVPPELFDRLLKKASSYLHDRDVFVFDGFVGADREHRLPIRVVADAAWHALFAHTLFLHPEPIDLEDFAPDFTVIDCGGSVTPTPTSTRTRPRRCSSASRSVGGSC